MQIVKAHCNEIRVIFSQTETQTINFLLKSETQVHFADITEFVKLSLGKAQEYLEHYQGVAERGNSPG